MPDPVTANLGLTQPTRGSDVGTWDVSVNGNTGILDSLIGGVSSIALNNTNVTLAAGQFQAGMLLFNSTLTGSVVITFPTTFITSYEVQNICTGTSAFTITLRTTAAGGQVVACPPGEVFEIRNDGANIKFKNFGRVGSYWDYAGSSVPAWVSGCTVPPYLNCDGTAFSSATYPALHTVLGGTTLPDARGRTRAALNQGTGRMTAAAGGVDGNTAFAGGGAESVTLATSQIPSHAHGITDPGHRHTYTGPGTAILNSGAGFPEPNSAQNTSLSVTGITINNTGGDQSHINMQPTYIGGLTLIRAA